MGMDLLNGTPANLYRAAMEGATYTLKHGFDAFTAAGMHFDAIVLTGGGAKSAAWRQMVADVFALPVVVPEQTEGAAFGAALQALWSLRHGQGDAVDLPTLVLEHVATDASLSAQPDPVRAADYHKHYARFLQHLDAVRPLYST
jgi:xylulokinase